MLYIKFIPYLVYFLETMKKNSVTSPIELTAPYLKSYNFNISLHIANPIPIPTLSLFL